MSRSAWKQICGLQGSSALWACLRDADGGLEGPRQQAAQAGALLGAQRQAEALAGARGRVQRLLHQRLGSPPLHRPCNGHVLLIFCTHVPGSSVPDWSLTSAQPCIQRLLHTGFSCQLLQKRCWASASLGHHLGTCALGH